MYTLFINRKCVTNQVVQEYWEYTPQIMADREQKNTMLYVFAYVLPHLAEWIVLLDLGINNNPFLIPDTDV